MQTYSTLKVSAQEVAAWIARHALTTTAAARTLGVGVTTLRRWKRIGAPFEAWQPAFIKDARAGAKPTPMRTVVVTLPVGDYRLLERRAAKTGSSPERLLVERALP